MWLALGAYALLAALAYLTLDGAFRAMVWIFCGGLAVMTLARAAALRAEVKRQKAKVKSQK